MSQPNTIKIKQVLAHMKAAEVYSKLSYCERLKVGAVLVKGDSILSYGYNGRPAGEPNVCEINPDTTHPDVVHAERNALKKMYRSSSSSEGSLMFQTNSPCRGCAIEIVDAGIKAVFFRDPYRLNNGIEFLLSRNVKVFQVEYENDNETCRITRFVKYPGSDMINLIIVPPAFVLLDI